MASFRSTRTALLVILAVALQRCQAQDVTPQDCSTAWEPVCSDAGIVYANECVAKAQGVTAGPCTGAPTAPKNIIDDAVVSSNTLHQFVDEGFLFTHRARLVQRLKKRTQPTVEDLKRVPTPPNSVHAIRVDRHGNVYEQIAPVTDLIPKVSLMARQASTPGFSPKNGDGESSAAALPFTEEGLGASNAASNPSRKLRHIFGPDSRREQSDNSFPGLATGQLVVPLPNKPGWFKECSGALIGSRAVLTAAHCVYEDGGWSVTSMTYAPGARNGQQPYGTVAVKYATIYSAWMQNTDYNYDIAVLTLSTDLGTKFGWLGYGYTCGQKTYDVTSIGFPTDKPDGTRWISTCQVPYDSCPANQNTAIATNYCPIISGQSGSPVFTSENMVRFVVSFEAQSNGRPAYNGVVAITPFHYANIAKWRLQT